MRKSGLLALVMVCVLMAGIMPAGAQAPEENSAVTDLGRNRYLVDGTMGEIPNLLPAEEVQKLAALQQPPNLILPLTDFSPDDEVVLATDLENLAFVNVADGSTRLLRPTADFARFDPATDYFWLDGRTLAQIGIEVLDVETGAFRAAMLQINRISGETRLRPLPNFPVDRFPFQVSPRGQKVLLVQIDEEALEEAALLRLPLIGKPVQQQLPQMPQWRERQVEQLRAQVPLLQRRAELAAALDPLNFFEQFLFLTLPTQISVYDLASTQTSEVSTIPQGTFVHSISWSEDSSRLALSFTHLLMETDEPEDFPRNNLDGALLSDFVYRDVTGNVPPAQNPFLQGNQLLLANLASGEQQRRMASENPDGALFRDVAYSTDNQLIMVKYQHPGRPVGRRFPIYSLQFLERSSFRFYNPALEELRRLETVELSNPDPSQPIFGSFVSPDEVIFRTHYGLDSTPYYYNYRSGEFRPISEQPGSYFFTRVSSSQARKAVFYYTSFTEPGELYTINWDGSGFEALTSTNGELRAASNTAQHRVSFRLAGGQTREGILILPADVAFPPEEYPIVFWQEGGPTVSVQNAWAGFVESPFALLPNFGFGVMVVPLYGRYGLGADRFSALADRNNYGQIDIDEQAAIVRETLRRGWSSAGKVGIAGCSYGGYFAHQSISRHPDLYDAAHAMCSLVDLVVEWNRGFPVLAPWFQGVPPWVNPREYEQDSPSYNANRVQTPLLSFHGTEDFLPVTLAENVHLQIVNNEVPARFLKFLGAGHGFGQNPNAPTPVDLIPLYELYGAQEQLIWFRTYLR